jgi:nitronate monooxygenase
MNWKNDITEKLKIEYPVIQAPMLGVSTPEMAAEISNQGGLGSLPVGGLSPEAVVHLIRKTKSLTDKPFAVNLFAHNVPVYADQDIDPMRQFLLQLAKKRGYDLDGGDLSGFRFFTYQEQIAILLQEEIPVVSFTFGCLDKENSTLLKDKGCLLIGTATCREEALILEEHNVDMITAQGIEAGGHRGTFLEDIPLPQIGLFSLLPQIVKATHLPVIAAGGIHAAQTIKAAFDLGAMAVQIGTAFIGTVESEAIPSYKKMLDTATGTDTVLTRSFSGRWARGFKNEFIKEIEASGITIPPYPIQNSLTSKLRKSAQRANDNQYTSLWAGQSAGATEMKLSKEIFRALVQDYENLYPANYYRLRLEG